MTDTIAAIATPPATGAIGIIRLSGPGARPVADRIFFPYHKPDGAALSSLPPRCAHFGRVLDVDGRLLDKALALVFPAPNSYTGEDCVELHCHGGLRLLDCVLSLCFANGARQAEAGEFTKRAFLNGRLDLTEAEAVADLIHAETLEGVRNAAGQLSGRLFEELSSIYNQLMDVTAHFTAYIDYTDEGVELRGRGGRMPPQRGTPLRARRFLRGRKALYRGDPLRDRRAAKRRKILAFKRTLRL